MVNKFFPVSIDIENKNILVVGAGKIACRKIKKLLEYNCNIKVITKKVEEPEINVLYEEKKINLEIEKEFTVESLKDVFLVIAATSDEKVNIQISGLCIEKNILINNVTSKDEMNLRFSSVYESEDFQIAVSAKGNPKKSKALREKIKRFLENNNIK